MLESDIHFTNKTQNIRNSETLTNHLLLFVHNRYPVNLFFQAGSMGVDSARPGSASVNNPDVTARSDRCGGESGR
jgi:hypothetical protein